jgi:hypothetical protein
MAGRLMGAVLKTKGLKVGRFESVKVAERPKDQETRD